MDDTFSKPFKKKIYYNKEEIFRIFNNSDSINNIFAQNKIKFDNDYNITTKDKKIFNFMFLYFFKTSKYQKIKRLLNLNEKKIFKNGDMNKTNKSPDNLSKANILISKFIIICLQNHNKISNYLFDNNNNLLDKILKITRIFFFNDIIDNNDLNFILTLQILLCLYNDKEKTDYIQNKYQIELVINFLTTFCDNKALISNEALSKKINHTICFVIKIVNKYILKKFENRILLSRTKFFFKLIELCRIASYEATSEILSILVEVYKYKFNVDYIFDDLSDQFLYKIGEDNILSKMKILIAKNNFLNLLFKKENSLIKGDIIKNGFYYSDFPNNGITFNSINKFPNENGGYSLAVSFYLMNNLDKKPNSKYTLFSIHYKDNNIISFYIEESKLKFKAKKENILFENISTNKSYVLWIFHSSARKHKMIIFLNENKHVLTSIPYPEGNYTINLGFSNNKFNISTDNFIGIIGTFILFKKCLVKDENDNRNITKLLELKGNYEGILYIDTKREWAFKEKNINLTLKVISIDINKKKDIEIVISPKSLGSEILLYNSQNLSDNINNEIYCNYFQNSFDMKNINKYIIKNKNFLKNNQSFPIFSYNSFFDFLNGHGFLYLQLELYYLIGIISYKIEDQLKKENKNNIKIFENLNEEEDFCSYLTQICSFFFYCLDLLITCNCLNNEQSEAFLKEIDNFKYTLIDLVTISCKYNCQIKIYFTMLFVQKMKEKRYFEYCSFILNYEFHEYSEAQIFYAIFTEIHHVIKDDYDDNIFHTIFQKLTDFNKLYIKENVDKNLKKAYSNLIRSLLKISIQDDMKICLNEYLDRIKIIKAEFEKDNLTTIYNNYTNINDEEESINENEKKENKLSIDLTSGNDNNNKNGINSRKESNNKRGSQESSFSGIKIIDKNLENIILLYKYLKNLYLAIDDMNKFIELFENKKNELGEFLNELFRVLSLTYPLQKSYLEKDMKIIKYAELIKCLCILFLDELFFKDNYAIIKEEEDKLKNKGIFLEDLDNQKSTGSLRNSFNSSGNLARLYNKQGKKDSFISVGSSKNLILNAIYSSNSKKGSFVSNVNMSNNTIEGVLTSQMEFFDDVILSQYTFKSLFMMLFRDDPKDKKLKFIKNKKATLDNFSLNEKDFPKTRYLLKVILSLLESQNSNGIDSCFITKVDLIKEIYNSIAYLFKNCLKNYLTKDNTQKKKENVKSMMRSIFINKGNFCYVSKFYDTMLSIILDIKEIDNNLLIDLQNDIKEFINNSLYYLKDPFFFKTLSEIFFKNDNMDEFIITMQTLMMENLNSKLAKNEKNIAIEINCKNALILLYKMIFYVNKRTTIIKNVLFLKTIYLFLSQVIDHCSIIYTKILFPIDESRGKLLMEIIYEIIFELHLESLRNPTIPSLQVAVAILKGLFNENKLIINLGTDLKHSIFKFMDDEEEDFTPFYIMDKVSEFNYENKKSDRNDNIKISEKVYINKKFFELRKKISERYKDESKENNNIFSSCILFAIKMILSLKELNEFYSNYKAALLLIEETNNKDSRSREDSKDNILDINDDLFISELKNQFLNISKNIQRIHKESSGTNPFKSIGYYSKNIYEHFRYYIVSKLNFNNSKFSNYINELIDSIKNFNKDLRFFSRVIYNNIGRTNVYSEKKYMDILKSNKKNSSIIINNSQREDNASFSSAGDANSNNSFYGKSVKKINKFYENDKEFNSTNSFNKANNIKGFYANNNCRSQSQLMKKMDLLNPSNINSNEENNKISYQSKLKFKKDLMRTYFSAFFNKILTYDEDFVNIKKIYKYIYSKDIKDIDKYKISYPTRIKSFITNNYDKVFLKRDFDFFTDGYFRYSHQYIYDNETKKYNYVFQNKLLFPDKKLLRENDNLHKDIFSKDLSENIPIYECEIITLKGSIFGNIYVFDNCLLFKSELKNDKRRISKKKLEKEYELGLNYVCSTMEYDFLNKEKMIVMGYNDIKEVVNRTFSYIWISVEIFLKDGKSFLFNLFNEDNNSDFFDVLKHQKIPIIRRVKEYFKKEEFSKKWKEEIISTYDYLLILNKLSSRTYNDLNQYPVMPWLFLIDGKEKIRNFDLPISVQDEKTKQSVLSKHKVFKNVDITFNGNHYSTSAYMYFYLMRANPFTNLMIRFQSNNFDVPDRQFTDIYQTIYLCQNLENNREMIPELFSIPEIYINFNDNDFGKQKNGLRIHNISFQPYAKNPIQFCYLIKDLINNNIDVNNQINKWFDFIFGVNQLGNFTNDKNMSYQERENLRILRKFNTSCYGNLFNYKKIVTEAQKHCKNNKSFYDDIKTSINLINSFGQCPFQLLTEIHPSKNKYIPNNNNNSIKSNYQMETNIFDESFPSKKNEISNALNFNKNIDDIISLRGKDEIIFFTKGIYNNYLYCLLKSGVIKIYKFDIKIKNFVSLKTIIPKSQLFFLKQTITNFPVFHSRYIFCEINENSLIFGRTLDRTLIYHNFIEDFEASFLLKSYIISILSINKNEFITGGDNGYLCKWRINIDNKEKIVDLELVLVIKSNKNSIFSLTFDEKLNVVVSSDINSLSIRKKYDFEFLNSITIKDSKNKYIVDMKISEFNFIYILIYAEEKNKYWYELQGYTLNGLYFGKYIGMISNFQISKTGKLIVNDFKQLAIKVLDPVNFDEINSKEIAAKNSVSYYFHFERPNIVYYGIQDKDYSKIKIIILYPEEKNIFHMNDI